MEQLVTKVQHLERINKELKEKLQTSANTDGSDEDNFEIATELGPKVVELLRRNREHISLDFAKTIADIVRDRACERRKVGNHLGDYISHIRDRVSRQQAEIEELSAIKSEFEREYNSVRQTYEQVLATTEEENDPDLLMAASPFGDSIRSLRDKCTVKDERIRDMRQKLIEMRRDIASMREACQKCEHKCDTYYREHSQVALCVDELETKAREERERELLNYSYAFSSASSLIGNDIPPPPPIKVPSVDELIRASKHSDAAPASDLFL